MKLYFPRGTPWRERVIEDENGCLVWQGALSKFGYSCWGINRPGRPHAYRIIFIMERGPVPEGLELDHLCRNKACVNPDHLEPVTHRENVLRSSNQVAFNARKTHCKNGHEFSPENTRLTNGKRYCRECLRTYARERMRALRSA